MRAKRKQIPVSLSSAQARSNPGQIIRRASAKKPGRFLIGLRGEPKVVVLGVEDYFSLIAPTPAIMAEMHAISKANGADKMTMDGIDAEIAACRAEQRAADVCTV